MGKATDFLKVYNAYWHIQYAFAANALQNTLLAEQVVGDVFTEFWHDFALIAPNDYDTYLNKTLKLHCSKKLRTLEFNPQQLQQVECALQFSKDRLHLDQDSKSNLLKTLDQLLETPNYERCLLFFKLRYRDNMSCKDIAKQQNVSIRNVEQYLTQALDILKSKSLNTPNT